MQAPDILLADEPVASLDPESSSQVMALIREIAAERGLTVICSLHQVDLALEWGDRVVGLRAGRVVLDTPTDHLSKDEVTAVYGRVATTPAALTAIDSPMPVSMFLVGSSPTMSKPYGSKRSKRRSSETTHDVASTPTSPIWNRRDQHHVEAAVGRRPDA